MPGAAWDAGDELCSLLCGPSTGNMLVLEKHADLTATPAALSSNVGRKESCT